MAAAAMLDAYRRLRPEALEVTPEDDRETFERMFPPPEKLDLRSNAPGLLGREASKFASARSLLGGLGGWLGGYVQEARMAAEAEAYAEAKIKEERGVGYKRGS